MNHRANDAVAGTFADREVARTCYDDLAREGFSHRWMALTQHAESEVAAPPGEAPLETGGRFVSDDGNSLRDSLEDHGIESHQAIEIDEELVVGGAVIVVAAHERAELAASIMRRGGGRVYKNLAAPGDVRSN